MRLRTITLGAPLWYVLADLANLPLPIYLKPLSVNVKKAQDPWGPNLPPPERFRSIPSPYLRHVFNELVETYQYVLDIFGVQDWLSRRRQKRLPQMAPSIAEIDLLTGVIIALPSPIDHVPLGNEVQVPDIILGHRQIPCRIVNDF